MPAPFTLVVETSTPHASLALAATDACLVEREFTSDRSHHACLFAPLAEILEIPATGEIREVLVGAGPGSYSGIRVGIAAAQGVALAHNCPVVAVPSLLALPSAGTDNECLVIGDARRGGFWRALVAAGRLLEPPSLTDSPGLVTAISAAMRQDIAVVSCEEPARFPLSGELAGIVRHEFPSAGALWRAWGLAGDAVRAEWTAAPPQPIYLKPPHTTMAKRPWLLPA